MSVNAGHFKKGFDSRRHNGPRPLANGKTYGDLCREKTLDAFNTLYTIMMDEAAPRRDRIKCAVHIGERGWGKAANELKIKLGEGVELPTLSTDQLKRIAAGDTSSLPLTIEGHCEDADTVPSTVPDEHEAA